jgi:hypothetical protein
MHVLVHSTSTSHPRQSKIKGTNQKAFYNIICFTFLSLDTQQSPQHHIFRHPPSVVFCFTPGLSSRHTYKRMEVLYEGGQGPEEAAVPYMDGMKGRIQKNR